MQMFCTSQDGLRNCVVPENIHTPPTEGFWFASPHPLGISVPRGSLMTPLPPEISTLREHGFCCNIYYYNIHFQHITLCYCSILFVCLLSGLKCSVFHENLFKSSVVMHGSILRVTIPPRATPGTSPALQARGWGIV